MSIPNFASAPHLPRPPRPGVPLYFGTMGPRTLRMAAPLADGVFFSVLASPAYVEHCLGHARAGLAEAGRDAGEIDAACYIIFSVDEDGEAARAAARGLIAHYLMRIPDTIRFEYAGLDVARMQSVQAGLRGAAAANRLGPAADALDDDIVAARAVAGTPEECIAGLQPCAAAGSARPLTPALSPTGERGSYGGNPPLFLLPSRWREGPGEGGPPPVPSSNRRRPAAERSRSGRADGGPAGAAGTTTGRNRTGVSNLGHRPPRHGAQP